MTPASSKTLLGDVRRLIAEAAAGQLRARPVLLAVSKRIRQEILKGKRAEYRGRIVSALRRQLGGTWQSTNRNQARNRSASFSAPGKNASRSNCWN